MAVQLTHLYFVWVFLVGLQSSSTQKSGKLCNSPLDIIIALDASGSVLKGNWDKSVDFASQLGKKLLSWNAKSRIGVIDFSEIANEVIEPSSDQKLLEWKLNNLKNNYQNGITRTELALKKAAEIFQRIDRTFAKKLLLILTDGQTTPLNYKQGKELIQEPMASLRTIGVHVIAVGVGMLVDSEELNVMASEPTNENVIYFQNYDEVLKMVDSITRVVCLAEEPQSPESPVPYVAAVEPVSSTCPAKYTKVGCFKDDMKLPRPLPKLLFTDRDSATKKFSGKSVDWQDWNSYINDLVCRCAKEAKVRNYAYFSIQFYGECWSGPQAQETYNRAGAKNTCITSNFEKCDVSDSKICVGEKETNFVYEVQRAEAEPTCGVEYHKLGCFKDNKKGPRLLNKLILTDRDSKSPVYSNIKIDWGNWNAYLPKLACRCAEKAADNKFTHFGLQFYGECWSGPEAAETYNQLGPASADSCLTSDYQPCPEDPKSTDIECVGKLLVNYVYTIIKSEDARCSVPFKPVGCFKDNQKKNARPLGELLLTYRDRKSAKNNGTEINWGEWDVYLYELVCLCAQKAKEKKYSHFGLQHYGECWSGPEAGETFSKDGPSEADKCIGRGFKTCNALVDDICVGREKTNFVFSLY